MAIMAITTSNSISVNPRCFIPSPSLGAHTGLPAVAIDGPPHRRSTLGNASREADNASLKGRLRIGVSSSCLCHSCGTGFMASSPKSSLLRLARLPSRRRLIDRGGISPLLPQPELQLGCILAHVAGQGGVPMMRLLPRCPALWTGHRVRSGDAKARMGPRCLLPLAGISLLALSGAARAADYVVQATVTDIDGQPLPGIQVAVGAIQKQPFKTSLQAEQTGTTDATGQVTVKLSTSSSPVGATVVADDPGRVHLPADPIVSLSRGTNKVPFQLLPLPDATKMAAGGTASTRGYFGDSGKATYPPLETQSFTLDDSPLHLWLSYGGQPGKPVLPVQGLFLPA